MARSDRPARTGLTQQEAIEGGLRITSKRIPSRKAYQVFETLPSPVALTYLLYKNSPFTQKNLAEMLNISQSTVSRYLEIAYKKFPR